MNFFLFSIWRGYYHIKAAAKRNNNFLLFYKSMPSSYFATRNVICPENPFYFKWYLGGVLQECEITAWVRDLG